MLQEMIKSCFLIFMAEMGDKTQILALAFATKYPVKKVLLGVMLGSLLNHGIAVALGSYLSTVLPLGLLRLVASFTFIGFGLWTLLADDNDDEESTSKNYGPVLTVAMAFFIGELGDKTQLTAITLSTSASYPVFVLAGTVLGMVLTSGVGILVGSALGNRIPEQGIKLASAGIFTVFGLVGLYENVPPQYLTVPNGLAFMAVLSVIYYYLIQRMLKSMKRRELTSLQRAAEELQVYVKRMKAAVDAVCLGESRCGRCNKARCPVGFTKEALDVALAAQDPVLPQELSNIPRRAKNKEFDRVQVAEALSLAISSCLSCGKDHDVNCVFNKTREALELVYFGEVLAFDGDMEAYLARLGERDEELEARLSSLRLPA